MKDVGPDLSKTTLAEFLRSEWLPAIRTTVRSTTFANYVTTSSATRSASWCSPSVRSRWAEPERFLRLAHQCGAGRRKGRPRDRERETTPRRAPQGVKRCSEMGYLTQNPADAADPPKQSAEAPREMSTWSAAQLRFFLEFVRPDPLHPVWFLLATTGMRRGEALGLRWCDVDLEAGHAAVRQSLVDVRGTVQISTPKTNRSRRVVALDQRTLHVLRDLRTRAGELDPRGSMFASCFAGEMTPNAVTKRFRRLIDAAGQPSIRLHDLRHTHATLALQAGVHPKIVSDRLGHSTVSLTLDVYSQAVPHMQRDAADQVARVLFE